MNSEYNIIFDNTKKDYDIVIGILSYDRYNKLNDLINSILNQKSDYTFCIVIIDDCSYDEKKLIKLKNNNIKIIKNNKNNGKELYWKTINNLLKEISCYNFEYFLQLDDDFLICENLINKSFLLFKENLILNNKKLGAISLHLNNKNDLNDNRWGLGVNWVDGGSIFYRKFLEDINFKISEISKKRWISNKNLSSGVWQKMSFLLKKNDYLVAKVNKSLLYHDDDNLSKMNYHQRILHNIKTFNFEKDNDKYYLVF